MTVASNCACPHGLDTETADGPVLKHHVGVWKIRLQSLADRIDPWTVAYRLPVNKNTHLVSPLRSRGGQQMHRVLDTAAVGNRGSAFCVTSSAVTGSAAMAQSPMIIIANIITICMPIFIHAFFLY